MLVVAALMTTEVAIELRGNVEEFMEDGDHLLVEVQVLKAGQAEREEIEHFDVADVVLLHLVHPATAFLGELAMLEAHGGDLGL